MIRQLVVLASGFLFAIGLGISEMTRPEKVLSFLNVFGDWDPSLAFVMGGAIVVYAAALQLAGRREGPKFGKKFHIPKIKEITPSLLIGSALFGVGWGLAGFCPGPALVASAALVEPALYFLPAMIAGILLHRYTVERRKTG